MQLSLFQQIWYRFFHMCQHHIVAGSLALTCHWKRHRSGQEFIEDHAKTVDIGLKEHLSVMLFRGHEFHRTAVTFGQDYPSAWGFSSAAGARVADGAVLGGVHAGYLHTHPAAHPHASSRFVAAAATFKLGG